MSTLDGLAVSVLTRAPVPGQTKRRLIPALGATKAAALHEVMLERTLVTAVSAQVGPVDLVCTPTAEHPTFCSLARRFGVNLRVQIEGDLGERMRCELQRQLQLYRFGAVVGSDCPGIQISDYVGTIGHLTDGVDAVLGPSRDGGYYLLGLKCANWRVFEDIPWGEDSVADRTRERFVELNWSWRELPERVDVDRVADIAAYPELSEDV